MGSRLSRLACCLLLFVLGTAGTALARNGESVPEIDPNSIGSAVALLFGGLMMLRARRAGR